MPAEFVHRVNLRDFDTGVELSVQREGDEILFAMSENYEEPKFLAISVKDAVVLAAHLRQMAGVMPTPPYPEDPYPDY